MYRIWKYSNILHDFPPIVSESCNQYLFLEPSGCHLYCWSSIVIALKVKTNLKQVHEDLEMRSYIS